MVFNQEKYHNNCIGRSTKNEKFEFDNLLLETRKEEVEFGVTTDNKLIFDSHIKNICKKAGQKLHALLRTYFLNSSQKILFLAEWQNLSSVAAL